MNQTNNRYRALLQQEGYLLLDGGTGTLLQQRGLIPGKAGETMLFQNPAAVTDIHRQYAQAGSMLIMTNTFSSSRHKLASEDFSVEEAITAAVHCLKEAVKDTDVLIGLDMGPIGELLEPTGTLTFEEAYEMFKEQAIAGEKAGADVVCMETMTDLYEVKAAVLAVKENTSLPVQATMSFEGNGRTFTGCSPVAMATVLTGLGVDALGINCSLGPKQIFPILQEMSTATHLPLIVKANAGLPDAATGQYAMSAEEFAEEMAECASLAKILGGCCGTTPEFISKLKQRLCSCHLEPRPGQSMSRLCTPSNVVELDGRVTVIGERINPTGKKRFQQALLEEDMDYITAQAIEQTEAGACILDVNVGHPGIDEAVMMTKTVKAIQSMVDVPLQIDSSNVNALEAGLRAVNGKAIVNSVNGEKANLERILPLVKKYGAAVVGLTLDEQGLPTSVEQRITIAKRILEAALSHGIPKEDVYIDCLTLTVSAQQSGAAQTLAAVERVRQELGLQTVLGVSNISFGLPNRELMNTSFLSLAMERGLTLPILNPNSTPMMGAVAAFQALHGFDRDCESYIEKFAGTNFSMSGGSVSGGSKSSANGSGTLEGLDLPGAVSRGLAHDAARLTTELLKTKSVLEIVEGILIPALDVVGKRYETGEIYLPQLMKSAEASKSAFEVLKAEIAKTGGESVSRGKIVLATVKGDIHDIGKNIVKAILANYGYQVIDLGRDVPVERVVEAALRENVPLVGLSALMTTTLQSMEDTIKALRSSGHDCKIVVGGAVLTEEYAYKIGADFYGRDARATVDAAEAIFS